jgi:hypothetical protein
LQGELLLLALVLQPLLVPPVTLLVTDLWCATRRSDPLEPLDRSDRDLVTGDAKRSPEE